MLTIGQLERMKVYVPKQSRKDREKGEEADKLTKLGRIHMAVFTPDGQRIVGFLVKRPDIAGMVRREDAFLAFDSFEVRSAQKIVVASADDAAYDDAARERLGIDWDSCVLWNGMDAKTSDGKELGYVNDAEFDPATGRVTKFMVGDGGLARSLVGSLEIPPALLLGYKKGFMVVRPEAASGSLNGGLAAAAGEATGRVQAKGAELGAQAGKAAGEAVDKGSRALGKAIGKAQRAAKPAAEKATATAKAKAGAKKPSGDQAAKTVGRQLGKMGKMFGSFKDEFDKASK